MKYTFIEEYMSHIKQINHVAIVVNDIDDALHFWRDGLGLEVTHVEDVPDQDSIVAFLPAGDAEVELVKPTSDASGVARFLSKNGPGLHHICFEVDDVLGCIQRLSDQGFRLINTEPVIGTGGKLIAFIHPESAHGVLVELYELTKHEPDIRLARARQLADRAISRGQEVAAGVLAFIRQLRTPEDNENVDQSSEIVEAGDGKGS
jgi:methylmalonyl-CoA/ethylmalonyl-CoA epimerase